MGTSRKTSRRAATLSRRGRWTSHLHSPGDQRQLRFESLEDRRLLAVFSVSNLDDTGGGSLREAVGLANNTAGPDEIVFVGVGTAGTIGLTTGELRINDTLTITGPGKNLLSIKALNLSRLVNFTAPDGSEASADLSISGVTLTGGVTTGNNALIDEVTETTHSGGGIRFLSSGQLTLTNSTVDRNHTVGDRAAGGGIFTLSGAVILNDSTISNNTTSGDAALGGGVFSSLGSVQAHGSSFVENRTVGNDADGGAISTLSGTVELTDSALQLNSTEGDGGAIRMLGGDLVLTRSIVTNNSANSGTGGGIYSTNGNLAIHSSVIAGNRANRFGGMRVREGTLTLNDSAVSNNTAQTVGGMGLINLIDTTVNRSVVSGNISDGGLSGGGIRYISEDPSDQLVLIDSEVSGNIIEGSNGSGLSGAGIFSSANVLLIRSIVSDNRTYNSLTSAGGGIRSSQTVTLIDSTVSGNSSSGDGTTLVLGGGISAGTAILLNSTVSGNSSSGGGGGIAASSVTLTNSTVSGNSTADSNSLGGGIRAFDVTLTNSTVTQNSAVGEGGGIYVFDPQGLSIGGSIVANNTASSAPDTNAAHALNYSLIGNTAGSGITDTTGVGNRLNQPALLGPLADHGGLTQTHALLPGSPAIDAGVRVLAEPLYDYRLDTFADSLGAGGDLNPLPSEGVFNGGVYEFDTNQGLETQIPAANADDYSIEIFFKFDILPTGYHKILDFSTDTHPDAGLYVNTSSNSVNRLRYLVEDGTGFFTSSKNLSADTWYHLVLTRDNEADNPLRSYIDGQLQTNYTETFETHTLGSFTAEGDSSTTKLVQLFHSDTSFGQHTGGAVDAIRFYDRPLTADEIVELFSAGPDGLPAVDQRGLPRPVGVRSDVGAFELQVTSSADFDTDSDVDGADFLAWQRGFGTTVGATRADGDSDADGDVDSNDLTAWKFSLGQPQTQLQTQPQTQLQTQPQTQPLSAVNSQPSAAGVDVVAPLPATAADLPAANLPAANLPAANLIDAAIVLALDSGSGRRDSDAPDLLHHEPIVKETAFAASELAARGAPAGVSDAAEWEFSRELADKTATCNEPWLANELLERVFA